MWPTLYLAAILLSFPSMFYTPFGSLIFSLVPISVNDCPLWFILGKFSTKLTQVKDCEGILELNCRNDFIVSKGTFSPH